MVMVAPAASIRFPANGSFPVFKQIVTASALKRAVETRKVKTEQTWSGETAVFFRCFVYLMDRNLKVITATMTLGEYKKKYGSPGVSRQAIRILSLPTGSVFQAVF